jgi:hypothetical protein
MWVSTITGLCFVWLLVMASVAEPTRVDEITTVEDCAGAELAAEIVQEAQAAAEAAAAAVEPAVAHSERLYGKLGRAATTQQPLSSWRESLAPVHIDVQQARGTRVVHEPELLNADDIRLVRELTRRVQASAADVQHHGNQQNAKHALAGKHCTFLNSAPGRPPGSPEALPTDPFRELAPSILRKLLLFADRAWREQGWSDPGGVLAGIAGPGSGSLGGVAGLKVRIVEHWEYTAGGSALDDDFHYDGGSVRALMLARRAAKVRALAGQA